MPPPSQKSILQGDRRDDFTSAWDAFEVAMESDLDWSGPVVAACLPRLLAASIIKATSFSSKSWHS